MEPHRGTVGKPSRERPEPGKRLRRSRLVEPADGGRDLRLGVRGRLARRRREDALGRALATELLERDAVEELAVDAPRGVPPEQLELGGRGEAVERRRGACGRDEDREAARVLGVQQVAGGDGVRRNPAPTPPRPATRPRAPASPAQKRATPRLSWTTASCACSPASRFSRSTVPTGQVANASPTRASTESIRANARPAAARLPPPRTAARRVGAPSPRGSVRTPSSRVRGGAPFRSVGAGAAAPTGVGLERDDPHDDDGRGCSSRGAVQATTRANGDTAPR